MQKYLEEAYFAYENCYQMASYGFFNPNGFPDNALELNKFSINKSTRPFHLEYPDREPKFKTFMFDFELSEFPHDWTKFVCEIFKEMTMLGAEMSWLSTDPGFDFDLLFNDYSAKHVYAFCELDAEPVYAESVEHLRSAAWIKRIEKLGLKWRLQALT